MATFRIYVNTNNEGEINFTAGEGRYCDFVEKKSFSANGWDGRIEDDNTIVLEAVRDYSDGVHSMRAVIKPNGWYKLTLKAGDRSAVETIKKGFLTRKGEKLNGSIGLAGGNIDCRYMYFRSDNFSGWMQAHGLTAVIKEDPNREFYLSDGDWGGGYSYAEVFTDGEKDENWEDTLGDRPESSCAYRDRGSVKVTGATWAIVANRYHSGASAGRNVILYTTQNPTKLQLPKIISTERGWDMQEDV